MTDCSATLLGQARSKKCELINAMLKSQTCTNSKVRIMFKLLYVK